MSIARFSAHQAFDPEVMDVLSSAFANLRLELGLSDSRGDRPTELVGKYVIESVANGLPDQTAIRHRVLDRFKCNPQ
jgi:hypothetical protein